ncbi:Alcohol dehydrogenase [archaeon HR06]|nr:Alcohol dehydrogenase [archaeon HR06]
MKAFLCVRVGNIETGVMSFEDVPIPIPADNQVLIRIKACGVCHSNLHMIEGDFRDFGIPAKLPIIPGHEITGVVTEVGRDVRSFVVGDRVGIQVLYESCRNCDFCLSGNENLCLERKSTGEVVDGGYAEYIVAPYDFIYRLPDTLGFEEAAPLFCPGVTAYRAVKKAGVTFGQKVAVIGVGGVGHMSLQFAKLAGAEVTAIDVNEETLKMAEELGADNVLLAREVEEHVSRRFDVVMVHAPSQKAVEQAQKIVKRAGTILMAVKGNMNISFPEEHKIISSVIGSRQDMRETLKIASTRKIKVKYTIYKLSEAEQVLIKLKQGKIVGRAVLTP